MIIGIGTDIVNIERIAKIFENKEARFKNKVFTKQEIEAADKYKTASKEQIHAHFAKRFAAKEAFVKATGFGFGGKIGFKDVWVETTESGKPELRLSKKAMGLFKKQVAFSVTLSDDYPYAVAFVIAEEV